MIKKSIKLFAIALVFSFTMSSCYTYTTVVGTGAQGNTEVTKWNSYFIFGLAPGNITSPKELAAGASDYTVTTKQSFVNGLLGGLTFGIYTPTTTTVRK